MSIDGVAALICILALAVFLWQKRKKVEFQRMLFPVLYVVMYRSKFGLKTMDRLAKKFPKVLRWAGYGGVVLGFAGMLLISVQLVLTTISSLTAPEAAPGIQPVLPIEAKGVFFVPFLYWIISIFLLAVVHECAHGVLSKVHKVKVKSSGFAFLCLLVPIIPAAFVEPEEKMLQKKRKWKQLSVFAAGPISNMVFAALMLLVFAGLSPVLSAAFEPAGVEVVGVTEGGAAASAGLLPEEIITYVDGVQVNSTVNLTGILDAKVPGEQVIVQTQERMVPVVLAENPDNASKAFMGVQAQPHIVARDEFVAAYGWWVPPVLRWFAGLFFWLFMLNIGIGLFNLLPIGPLDGGQMYRVLVSSVFRKKKKTALRIQGMTSLFFVIIIVVNLLIGIF